MRLERIDPRGVDIDTAAEIAALVNAAEAVDAPHQPLETARSELLYLVYGWENRPVDAVFLAYDDQGCVVGRTYVELPVHDNVELGVLGVQCRPDHRDGPLPAALLEAGLSELRSIGRTGVLVDAWRDSFWRDFYVANGFDVAFHSAQRRLRMSRLDWTDLDRLHATSLEASPGYDLVEVPVPAADHLVPGLLDLHRAMNDAPIDDLAIEDEVWDVDRLRAYEQAMTNRGHEVVQLVAVRRADGVLGGFTVMTLDPERPTLGFQDDTGVVGEHRGHRLGLRLKTEMLRLLRDRYPLVETVDTWNAESNDHMVAVNDALGCEVVAHGVDLQRAVD